MIYDGDLLRRIVYAKIFLLGVQDDRGLDIALDQMQSRVTWEDVQCRPILRGEKDYEDGSCESNAETCYFFVNRIKDSYLCLSFLTFTLLAL